MPLLEEIFTGAQIASTVANPILQAYQNKANRKFVEKQYRVQRADAIADRDFANEYNSPTNQMKRLREAGLNPHLAINGGNQGGVAASVNPTSSHSYAGVAPQIETGYLSAFMDMKQKGAQINLTEQQAENEKSLIELNKMKLISEMTGQEWKRLQIRMGNTMLPFQASAAEQSLREGDMRLKHSAFDLDMKQALKAPTIEGAVQNLVNQKLDALQKEASTANTKAQSAEIYKKIDYIREQIKNISTDTDIKKEDLRLLKEGINRNDPTWQRVLIQQASKFGILDKISNIFKGK